MRAHVYYLYPFLLPGGCSDKLLMHLAGNGFSSNAEVSLKIAVLAAVILPAVEDSEISDVGEGEGDSGEGSGTEERAKTGANAEPEEAEALLEMLSEL